MSPTIAAALDAYEEERRDIVIAPRRLARAAALLRRQLGAVDAADRKAVGAAIAGHIAARRAAGRADGTIRRELIVLRAALMGAWKAGDLADRPYVGLPPAPTARQRWLSQEEVRRLLHRADLRVDLFIRLALATGARAGAILELTWDRVDFQRGIIDFRAPHPLAHRRKRRAVVPAAPALLRALASERRRIKAAPADRVVPVSLWLAERLVRQAAAEARIDGVTPHVLRHTAATWMLARKVPLVDASRMLGHASTLITEQVYAHLVVEALRPAADTLADLLTPR